MKDDAHLRLPAEHVDPAVISVWRWAGAIAVFALAVAAAVPLFPLRPSLAFAAAFSVAILGSCVAWYWPPALYRHLTYRIDEFGLVIQEGVLWRSQTTLPRVRIQHSDVSQGPLQRRYGIATLKLYTAGSRYTKVELPGLSHDQALALRDSLLDRSPARETPSTDVTPSLVHDRTNA